MSADSHRAFVSRAGDKLQHALDTFAIDPTDFVCADLGSNVGGFVDCLIQRGAARVYAVERGYGVVDYRLRNDPRVVVMERTDAIHVRLPEPVDLVTIDAGWTRQTLILPAAIRLLRPGGSIVTLIKPHYEAEPGELVNGVLPDNLTETAVERVRVAIQQLPLELIAQTESPIRGHGGNREFLWYFTSK